MRTVRPGLREKIEPPGEKTGENRPVSKNYSKKQYTKMDD